MDSLERETITNGLSARLAVLVDGVGSDLRPAFVDILSRHGHSPQRLNEAVLFHPLGHPMVQLIDWAATSLDPQTQLDLMESAVAGYLAVRAQDDLLDEAVGGSEVTLLSTVILARHQALLARHVADVSFWTLFEERWAAYAAGMAAEERLHHPTSAFTDEDYEMVLQRSMPLLIPPAAVLALEDRSDQVPDLTVLVDRLVRATQLYNDFHDAPDDLRAGNHTRMVRRLTASGHPIGREMVRMSHDVVTEIESLVDDGRQSAHRLGFVGFESWARQRMAAVRAGHEALLASFLDQARTTLDEFG